MSHTWRSIHYGWELVKLGVQDQSILDWDGDDIQSISTAWQGDEIFGEEGLWIDGKSGGENRSTTAVRVGSVVENVGASIVHFESLAS